jgi:hypothetical protein
VLTAGHHHFTAVTELWFVQTETQHTHFCVSVLIAWRGKCRSLDWLSGVLRLNFGIICRPSWTFTGHIAITHVNSLHFGRPTSHFLITRERILLYVTLTTVFSRIGTVNEHYKFFFFPHSYTVRLDTINLMFLWPCIIVSTYFNNQLNAQILLFCNNMYVTLQSSTCFEHRHDHLQEDKLYYHCIWYRHCLYCTAVYRGWRYQMLW